MHRVLLRHVIRGLLEKRLVDLALDSGCLFDIGEVPFTRQ